jgi:hypothetical protein
LKKKYPDLRGFDSEDAEWDLSIGLDQLAAIYAMQGWPLFKGVATPESLEQLINSLVTQITDAKDFTWGMYGGRPMIRRNPSAPSCLEISLDIGHLDFSEALEARDGDADGKN